MKIVLKIVLIILTIWLAVSLLIIVRGNNSNKAMKQQLEWFEEDNKKLLNEIDSISVQIDTVIDYIQGERIIIEKEKKIYYEKIKLVDKEPIDSVRKFLINYKFEGSSVGE